jgi:hypothetical protein
VKRRLFAIAAAGLALAPAGEREGDESFAPSDFAWGRAVEAQTRDPLQTLLLDVAVYRGAVAPDLADLRVFNSAGEVVPHAIRPLVDPSEDQGALVEVPLFRLPRSSALAIEAADSSTVRARDIAIEVAADGAIVRVASDSQAADQGATLPSAYLIDLSPQKRDGLAVAGLDLALSPEPAEFAAALRVEASDDLVHFTPLAARASLARLDQSGHRIEQSRIELPSASHRYLLLAAGQPLPVELLSVRARLAPVIAPPPRTRERITGVLTPNERRVEFLFDLGGPIPVDRVQVELPVPNTVIEADLYSAPQESGPWLHHFSGVLYSLDRAEGALRNAEVAVPPIRRRYFKLAVAEKGGGLGGGVPSLEVAWMPEQLLFVARGAGPFALGYGRAQAPRARFDAAALIQSALPPDADPHRDIPRETARLGPVEAVGDPSVLQPHVRPPEPRTIALWCVLVASVAFVLVLSMRLLRRMGSREDEIRFQ